MKYKFEVKKKKKWEKEGERKQSIYLKRVKGENIYEQQQQQLEG